MEVIFPGKTDRAMHLVRDGGDDADRTVGAEFRRRNFKVGCQRVAAHGIEPRSQRRRRGIDRTHFARHDRERLLHGLEFAERPSELLTGIHMVNRQRERLRHCARHQADGCCSKKCLVHDELGDR